MNWIEFNSRDNVKSGLLKAEAEASSTGEEIDSNRTGHRHCIHHRLVLGDARDALVEFLPGVPRKDKRDLLSFVLDWISHCQTVRTDQPRLRRDSAF